MNIHSSMRMDNPVDVLIIPRNSYAYCYGYSWIFQETPIHFYVDPYIALRTPEHIPFLDSYMYIYTYIYIYIYIYIEEGIDTDIRAALDASPRDARPRGALAQTRLGVRGSDAAPVSWRAAVRHGWHGLENRRRKR